MRRFLFIIIFTIFFIPHTKAFAQTVCGSCNSAGVFYCDFPGGFTVTDCGTSHPTPTTPPAPTSTPVPENSGLTLSPTHGCLNTPIKATLNKTADPAIGYFDNNGQAGISAFFLVDGFPSWINNTITIVPNQTMQYDLPSTGAGEGGPLIAQISNNLDYPALSKGPAAYPITFTFAGNSPQPPNVTAMYTVDASCFPSTLPTTAPMPTPTNTPIPTHVPTPTNTPIPTATLTPGCHMVETCPTGPSGSIQVCTSTCE